MTDNPNAFPTPHGSVEPDRGLTLRDYFAAAAMPGIERFGAWPAEHWAAKAYEIADAMLKEREKAK